MKLCELSRHALRAAGTGFSEVQWGTAGLGPPVVHREEACTGGPGGFIFFNGPPADRRRLAVQTGGPGCPGGLTRDTVIHPLSRAARLCGGWKGGKCDACRARAMSERGASCDENVCHRKGRCGLQASRFHRILQPFALARDTSPNSHHTNTVGTL